MPAESINHVFRDKNNNGAAFTARSLKTGKDYTFKVARSKFHGRWYTHVYVEKGYMDFQRLGHYKEGKIHAGGGQVADTPAAVAAAWLLSKAESQSFDALSRNVELFHIGSCVVCGKPLTDAQSIQMGVGPICRTR